MAKWTDYTTDTNPTDNDEVMTLDADKSPKANKRVTLSTLADYFLDKLASKVFAKLETRNQTVIGALNELNSKARIESMSVSNSDEFRTKVDDYSKDIPDDSLYNLIVNVKYNNEQLSGGGCFFIRGMKTNSLYEWQECMSYGQNSVRHYFRSKYNGTWQDFK